MWSVVYLQIKKKLNCQPQLSETTSSHAGDGPAESHQARFASEKKSKHMEKIDFGVG